MAATEAQRRKWAANYASRTPQFHLFHEAKKRARREGLPFDLVKDELIVPEFCPVLGIPLFRGARVQGDNSPSVDRFDPSRGYVRDNVEIISMLANRIKNSATVEQVEAVARWMRQRVGCAA